MSGTAGGTGGTGRGTMTTDVPGAWVEASASLRRHPEGSALGRRSAQRARAIFSDPGRCPGPRPVDADGPEGISDEARASLRPLENASRFPRAPTGPAAIAIAKAPTGQKQKQKQSARAKAEEGIGADAP